MLNGDRVGEDQSSWTGWHIGQRIKTVTNALLVKYSERPSVNVKIPLSFVVHGVYQIQEQTDGSLLFPIRVGNAIHVLPLKGTRLVRQILELG